MRLQVICSDELCGTIDAYAKFIGCSRSSLCSLLIAQGLSELDKHYKKPNSKGFTISDRLKFDIRQ